MKNYFKFTLTGKQLFPVWALLILLFLFPTALYSTNFSIFRTPCPGREALE